MKFVKEFTRGPTAEGDQVMGWVDLILRVLRIRMEKVSDARKMKFSLVKDGVAVGEPYKETGPLGESSSN